MNINSILFVLTFALFASKHTEAGFGFGSCYNVPVISNFDATAYSGLWYEITKFPVPYELGLSCITAEYGFVNSSYITVKNSGYNSLLKQKIVTNGFATVANRSMPNYLAVTFPQNIIGQQFQFTGPYRVWATDYTSYSVVYSCSETKFLFFTFKSDSLWILARQKTLNQTVVDNLKRQISAASVNVNNLQMTDQSC